MPRQGIENTALWKRDVPHLFPAKSGAAGGGGTIPPSLPRRVRPRCLSGRICPLVRQAVVV